MPFNSSVRASYGPQSKRPRDTGRFNGSSAALPGLSAYQIKTDFGTNTNGYYYLNLGNGQGIQQVYCIMDSAVSGGGWMVLWGAPVGTVTYEQRFTAEAQNINSTPIGNYHSQNYARRSAISQASTLSESLFYTSNSEWMKMTGKAWNSSNHNSGNFRFEFNASIVTSNGTEDTTVEFGATNFDVGTGGDMGIAINSDGLDHHSGSYYNLNSSCVNSYIYNYGPGYKTSTALSGWKSTTIACVNDNQNQYAFLVAMR
jgi:hypothetical protein